MSKLRTNNAAPFDAAPSGKDAIQREPRVRTPEGDTE